MRLSVGSNTLSDEDEFSVPPPLPSTLPPNMDEMSLSSTSAPSSNSARYNTEPRIRRFDTPQFYHMMDRC